MGTTSLRLIASAGGAAGNGRGRAVTDCHTCGQTVTVTAGARIGVDRQYRLCGDCAWLHRNGDLTFSL